MSDTRRRFRWWHVPVGMVLLVLAIVLLAMLRLQLRWDLTEVEARAEAAGIDLKAEPPAAIAEAELLYNRLAAVLDAGLIPFEDSPAAEDFDDDRGPHRRSYPQRSAYYASLDPALLQDFRDRIDTSLDLTVFRYEGLGDALTERLRRSSYTWPLSREIDDATRLLDDLLLTAPADRLFEASRRLLRWAAIQDSYGQERYAHFSVINHIALRALNDRLPDLQEQLSQAQRDELAGLLQAEADRATQLLIANFEQQLLLTYRLLVDGPLDDHPHRDRAKFEHEPLFWLLRLGRAKCLELHLDYRSHLQPWPGWRQAYPNSWDFGYNAAMSIKKEGVTNKLAYLASWKYFNLPVHFVRSALRIQMHQRLLAAELTGREWPIDDFDPDGARLRPLIIDGIDYGAYSVGQDGTDDGGHRQRDIRYYLNDRAPPKPPPQPRRGRGQHEVP